MTPTDNIQLENKLESLIALYQSGRQADALPGMEQLLADNPGYVAGWRAFGLMAANSGDMENSIGALRRAAAIEFLNPDIYLELATSYWRSGEAQLAGECAHCVQALSPGHPEAAKIIALGPDQEDQMADQYSAPGDEHDPVAFETDGSGLDQLARRGDYDALLREADEILSRRPDDARAHYFGAIAYQSFNDITGVICRLKNVTRAMPAFAGAHKALGDYLFTEWRLEKLTEPIRLSMEYGAAVVPEGNLADAERYYNKALVHQPDDAEMRNYLGKLMWELGRLNEALEQFSCAVKLESRRAAAQFNLANALKQTGSDEQALSQIELGIKFDAGFREAHFLRAGILSKLGRVLEAGKAYSEASEYEHRMSTEACF